MVVGNWNLPFGEREPAKMTNGWVWAPGERKNDRGHYNEKRAAIADGHCINSQQKRSHQQPESTGLQRCN